MFLYYTRSGRSWPGAALAARVEGGVVGEALADAVASAVGRRGAVGAAPAGVAREASTGVRGWRRASEKRGPRCSRSRAAAQAVGVERRVVRISLADVVGAAPRRRGALVVVAAAGVAHEASSCRCRSRRRLAGRGRRLGRRRWRVAERMIGSRRRGPSDSNDLSTAAMKSDPTRVVFRLAGRGRVDRARAAPRGHRADFGRGSEVAVFIGGFARHLPDVAHAGPLKLNRGCRIRGDGLVGDGDDPRHDHTRRRPDATNRRRRRRVHTWDLASCQSSRRQTPR